MADIDQILSDLLNQIREDTDKKVDSLKESVVDQNEELLATYIEGTRRSLKATESLKDTMKSVATALTTSAAKTNATMSHTASNLQAIERAVKSQRPASMLRTETILSSILKSVQGIKFPTDAKNPVAVRLSNGEEFVEAFSKAAERVLFTSAGGGRTPSLEVTGGTEVVPTVDLGSLVIDKYDYVSVAYPTATSEVYTFRTGGSAGTRTATVTLNYTDATKESLSTATRT